MTASVETSGRIADSAPSAKRLAGLLMGGALLSKVLGLLREILIARAIGASLVADSFRGGLTAVLLPLVILQGETVPAILIPTYREWDRTGDAARRFGALTLALTLIAFLLFGVVELTAPFWIDLLLGGFGAAAHDLTLAFTRVMALAMPASVLLCCLSASEIARGRSRITSIRAALVNVAVIGGVLLLLATGQTIALAWSFTLAFNAVAVWAIGAALKEGTVSFRGVSPGEIGATFMLYMRRLRPLLLQPLAEQGEIWIERLLASALAVGTLASLDYARTLSDSATLLIGQPLGLAVLSAGPGQDTRTQMEALARPVLAISIPGSIFLVCFAPELVELVFHRGAFGPEAITLTSNALRGIAAGLWATTLGYILLRMLNNLGWNRRATAIVAIGYIANALTGTLLVHQLGGFALGFGEAVRGVVVLTGVTLALGCIQPLLRVIRDAVPGIILLIVFSSMIMTGIEGVLLRLFLGAAATALSTALSVLIMVPRTRALVGTIARRVV